MRLRLAVFSAVLCCVSAFGADLTGIQVSDMDRKADPCNDFYEYSNGAWRANNPIPSSMDRWSRRWQAGETNKEKLRTILEACRRQDQPAQGKHQRS